MESGPDEKDAAMSAQTYAAFFEALTEATPFEAYSEHFEESATFEDPFHKVTGSRAIYGLFQAMYKTVHAPVFYVDEIVEQGDVAYLRWDFSFSFRPKSQIITFKGVSRVRFADSGKVSDHVDYWDAGEHIYGHLPLVGTLVRFAKKRIQAS